jgi:hypothetical protein
VSDDFEITEEDERIARQIEREIREHPVASALPTGRARSLIERIAERLREHGAEVDVDKVMTMRARNLDEAARRKEHEE